MDYAKYIDHTILKAFATKEDIKKLTDEAKEYGFKTVCVNSSRVQEAREFLEGSKVGITSVIGFPLGACTTATKIIEANQAITNGADEIDMVINIGKMKDKEYEYVLNEINSIKNTIGEHILKVIVETALLNNDEIKKISEIVKESKADFIKTSTGFSTRGATFEDVEIMNNVMQKEKEIKAAGGIKTLDDLKKMLELNVTRIGTSNGVAIIENKKTNSKKY